MPESSRLVLVAGASGRLGGVIAAGLAAAGTDLILVGRHRPDELAGRLARDYGIRAVPIAADVTDEKAMRLMAETAASVGNGRLDAVISSVTGFDGEPSPAAGLAADTFRRVVDTDLTGVFLLAQASLPMLERSAAPRVVLISSLAGLRGRPGAAHLCAAKAGLTGLVLALAREWALKRILVNAVAPGPIRTPGGAEHPPVAGVRFNDAEDVAAPVLFLSSAANRQLTGQILAVNGGEP
jgi:3-oxoacyl-[acyl-carrier protein] reductase